MKTAPILFQNERFTITEDTIFYPFCAIIGPPIILWVSSIVNPSVSPLWGLSCYLLSSDSNKRIYTKRVKGMIVVIWTSSLFCFLSVLLIRNHLLQTLVSLLGYLYYKNTYSERLAPYLIGFVNIAILTSSPILGVVGKDTLGGILQILHLSGEAMVGFFASFISLVFYSYLKKGFLFLFNKRGGHHLKQ